MNNGNLFETSAPAGAGGWYTAHCDGGSRGNPGPSGFGAVIEGPDGRTAARLSEFLGIQTNNYAEYSGLLAVLKWATENNARRMRVVSDSELMVKQMKGQYKVGSPGLRPLFEQARRLSAKLEAFEMRHTLRGGNKEADKLANDAMDRGMGRTPERVSAEALSRRVSDAPLRPDPRPVPVSGASSPRPISAPTPRQNPNPAQSPVQTSAPTSPQVSGQGLTPARPGRIVLEGFVKDGVVHLVEGELPDGIFVKVVKE